jgi:Urate oxidase N-terminal
MATLAFGILILGVQEEQDLSGGSRLFEGDYYKSAQGVAISTGILLAVTMFANVWLVIWPNQKKVIANARNVLAGGEADPEAAAAGRRAALASRQNTIYSFAMLWFMIATAHFVGNFNVTDSGDRAIYWVITLVIWLALELNCLGVIGGTSPQGTNWIYEDHKRAIGTGLVLVVVWYLLWAILF